MSLAAMLNGEGTIGLFEGVSEEARAKYSIENGSVVMAMESAEMLNTAFMEGFYEVNDIEISAVIEGYQSVTESSDKMKSIKERLKHAIGVVAELFRKMGQGIRAFFVNIAEKIKERALASDRFFNSIPGHIKTITYEGYNFQGLDTVRDIFMKVTPDAMLNSCKEISDVVSGKDKITEQHVTAIKEAREEMLKDLRRSFKIDDKTSLSEGFWSYFRSGASKDDAKECKISVSELRKITKSGDKLAKNIDQLSKDIEKDYLKYAAECDKTANEIIKDGGKYGQNIANVRADAWRAIAETARGLNTYLTTLASSWASAYNEACAQWGYGTRAYLAKEKKSDNGGDE